MDDASGHRLFVGLSLPAEVGGHLQATLAALPVDLRRSTGVRWTASERWHLTMAFLGSVDESCLPRLQQELAASVSAAAPLTPLALCGAGRFGTTTAWIGIGWCDGQLVEPNNLQRLASDLRRACRAARCPPPDHDRWQGHVTIARRRRDAPPAALVAVTTHLADYRGPAWRATEVTLFESFLGPSPRHVAVGSWPING